MHCCQDFSLGSFQISESHDKNVFFLIQIEINTSLKRQLALDSFRVLNLSECGGLTYSLKPCTHADSLSRFFSKRKSGGNWQMSERLAIVSHNVHFP